MDEKTKEVVNNEIFDSISDSKLTLQEQDFVLYYLDSHNIKQAFMKAYNCEKKYAQTRGYEIYHRPHVQSEIKRLKKLMRVGYDIDPSKYVETLMNVANADISDYIKFAEEEVPEYDDEGNPYLDEKGNPRTRKVNKMHLANSNEVDCSIITEVKQGRDGISIKLMDKLKALSLLKDFMGWQKADKEEKEADKNELIKTLQESSKEIWDGDADKDLEEMKKAEKG